MRQGQFSVVEIRKAFPGRVIVRGDRDYDAARTVFYGGFDRKPAAVIRVNNAADVSRAVTLAGESGLELAVRSGGHSLAGHSVSEGGIVIDLRDLKNLDIDERDLSAWADTGLTAREYTEKADTYGLATGFGDTGSVGIGGITLAGGIGYLVRKYGMTIDNVITAEIVTAGGQVLLVDDETHPDLFWAIRGGGGNFGVVTRFRYRLHTVGQVLGGMLVFRATPDVISGFLDAAAKEPDELSVIVNVMPAMPMPFIPAPYHGKLIVMAVLMYAGDPESGMRAIAPLRNLAAPLADTVRPMRYPEIFFPDDGSFHPTAVSRTMFIQSVDRAAAQAMLSHLESSDASIRVVQLRTLGGAMGRVPADATAFYHRASPVLVNVAAFYNGAEDKKKREAWVTGLSGALSQGNSGMYAGFMGPEGPSHIRNAYPEAIWNRLVAVKRRYDPENLFRLNHNIQPVQT